MGKLTASVFVKQNILGQASEISGFVTNLVFNVLFPIILGAVLFGKLSIILGFAYLLAGLFNSGFDYAAVKSLSAFFSREEYGKLRSAFSYIFKIKIAVFGVFAFLLFIASDLIAQLYGVPGLSEGFKLVAALVLFRPILSFLRETTIALRKVQYSLITILAHSLELISIPIILYYIGFGFNGVLVGVVVSYLLAVLLISWIFYAKLRKILRGRKMKINKRKINHDIFNFSLISLSTMFSQWGILLILGLFVAIQNVGFFKISLSWIAVVASLIPISGSVVFASFIGLKSVREAGKLERYVSKTMKYALILIIPAMFGLFTLGDKLIRLVYGVEFVHAYVSLKILCWAIFPIFLTSILFTVLTAYNKVGMISRAYLSATILTLIFSLFAINILGLEGASFSYLFFYALVFTILSLLTYKFVPLKVISRMFKHSIKPLISSLVMAAVIIYFKPVVETFTYGVLVVLLSILIYFIVLFLIRGITKQDLSILKKVRG